MRKTALRIAALAMLCTISTIAWSLGKTTIDPNAAGAPAVEEKTQPDSRLAQKVTYDARRKSIRLILADLSRMTGVTIWAGTSKSDWQVRDRKMNVFAKDVPLADLMSSIARVMKFKWSIRGEPGAQTYRLYMDRRTLLDAETRKLRDEEKRWRKEVERRRQLLSALGSLEKLPENDLAALKSENPYLYVFGKLGIAGSLAQFLAEVPAALEALAHGQQLALRAADLSPSTQRGLAHAAGTLMQLESGPRGGSTSQTADDLAGRMNEAIICVNEHLDGEEANLNTGFILGSIRIQVPGTDDANIPFVDAESEAARALGRAYMRADEEQRPLDDVMSEMRDEMMAVMFAGIENEDTGEPAADHSEDDPALKEKITIDGADRLELALENLSKASSFSVVSDSFSLTPGSAKPGQEIELKEALDIIASGFRYNWDRRKSVIEFRDRDWFRKRAAQVPDEWIEGWRETLKKSGTLDIGDLAQIANLDDDQFTANILADEELAATANEIYRVVHDNKQFLRFYGSLSGSQRSTILTGGLPIDGLPPNQAEQARKLVTLRNPLYERSEIPVRLTGTRTRAGKTWSYSFRAQGSDDLQPIEWHFVTPMYVEPPKREPEARMDKTAK